MRAIQSMALVLVCACVACSGGSSGVGGDGGVTSSAASGPHGSFVMQVGSQTYRYDCDAQPSEVKLGATIETLGCDWPSTNPVLEIDFGVQLGGSPMAIEDQTFDLSSVSPNQIEIVAGLMTLTGTDSSIYSSGGYPDPNVSDPDMITEPGTAGSVVVHSYDPSTRHLDISLSNVRIPLSTGITETYPNSPPDIVIESAEIVR